MSLLSVVHVSSTFESGAMLHDCLSVDPQVQSSILHFYSEPHELIVIHASSTTESGAPRIDCLALFAYPPPANLIRRPMN